MTLMIHCKILLADIQVRSMHKFVSYEFKVYNGANIGFGQQWFSIKFPLS